MKFRCNNCSHKLSVPAKHAGKKAKCPHCGHALIVPNPAPQSPSPRRSPKASLDNPRLLNILPEEHSSIPAPWKKEAKRPAGDDDKPKAPANDLRILEIPLSDHVETQAKASSGAISDSRPEHSAKDLRLLDISPADVSQSPDPDQSAEAYQELQSLQGGRLGRDREPPPERKLPWIVDIFLYPTNRAGMTMLLICTGIPFFLRVLVKFCFGLMVHVPVLLILWAVSIVVHWGTLSLLVLYMNWYLWECIRDSAAGGIRAAETVGTTPGFGEILGHAFKGAGCLALCLVPAIAYLVGTHSIDGAFFVLYALGGFAFPMALLAVVMYDSFSGLNPFLVVRSIFRTLLRYFVMVPFCYVLCLLFPVAYYLIPHKRYWHFAYPLLFIAYYLILVMGHLLGRFYFKNEETLYWDD